MGGVERAGQHAGRGGHVALCGGAKKMETMPQTQAVTDFLQKLDYFYEMVEDTDSLDSIRAPQQPNGKLPHVNNNTDNENNATEDGVETGSEMNHSYNVTQLLKQDLRRFQEDSGIITSASIGLPQHSKAGSVNGLNGTHETELSAGHKINGGSHPDTDREKDRVSFPQLNGSHNQAAKEEEEEDEEDEEREVEDEDEEAEEEEEEVQGATSTGGSRSVSDSETENEEFCDTSDEPIEQHQQSTDSAQLLSESIQFPETATMRQTTSLSTSTPLKSVHFDHTDGISSLRGEGGTARGRLSDSLIVNTTTRLSPEADLSGLSSVAELDADRLTLDRSSDFSEVLEDKRMDISTCRGGDDERDRRKRAGQGSRDAGAHSGRGASGGAGSPGRGRGGSGRSGGQGLVPGSGGGGGGGQGSNPQRGPTDLNEQIVVTLLRLQHDMSGVLNRLNSLEALVKEGRAEKEKKTKERKSWWPFGDLSAKSLAVILVWPLVVHVVLSYIGRRRRRLQR